jgi:hypothetical protein
VVRVAVGVDDEAEPEAELSNERRVATVALEHSVDQHRLARRLVGEEVRVRARDLVEELAEEHARLPED